jgi:hypothetical protein
VKDEPAELLEDADAVMACWRVFGLDRDYQNRPTEGWRTTVALAADPDVQLIVTVGPLPDYVVEGVKGRWAHGIFALGNMFGNQYAGKTKDEIERELEAVDTDKVVARLKGPFNLYLTIELRTNVRVRVRPEAKYRWLADTSDLDMLEDFAAKMEPHLDATLVALLPELGGRLTPMMTTTPRLFPYLMVPGRATFGLPKFDGKAHVGVVSVDGWEVIDFDSLGSAVERVAGDHQPANDLWQSGSQWLLAAMGQEDDALRSFLFAFIGLEALTNSFGKVFEKTVVSELGAELGVAMEHLTWPSPRDSDAPWRNLVYRFALMAIHLDRAHATTDIDEFKELAAMRNGMAHGRSGPGDVDELPGHRSIALLRKYLGLAAQVPRPIRA